jgi:uncharacterized protein with PQ loop repeat
MEHRKYQFIAIISGIFTILGFSHMIYRVYTTRQTEHLTFIWIFFVIMSQSLLVLYGLLNRAYGIYLPAIIILTGISYVLYIKLSNTETTTNKIDFYY